MELLLKDLAAGGPLTGWICVVILGTGLFLLARYHARAMDAVRVELKAAGDARIADLKELNAQTRAVLDRVAGILATIRRNGNGVPHGSGAGPGGSGAGESGGA